ncbi:hypothetical protein BYT27DRAFT_7246924 [Phlegmacium glaucopus]|nr:hypothetical protein BYT27DRAFT_7246924 [Phlegmacium glaucopus]
MTVAGHLHRPSTTDVAFCSCRRQESLPITGADVGRLLRDEHRNPTQKYLCHPQILQKARAQAFREGVQSSSLHGTALAMGRRGRDDKHLSSKKGNGMGPEEPYLGIASVLESGGGVDTLSPNLRFRKNATV